MTLPVNHGRLLSVEPTSNSVEILVGAHRRRYRVAESAAAVFSVAVGSFLRFQDDDETLFSWDYVAQGMLVEDGEVSRLQKATSAQKSRAGVLFCRNKILRAVRAYFESEHFFELEAPLAVRGTCPDLYIDSFEVDKGEYLATSTEYHIKRMVVAGFERVYTLTKNFRPNECTAFHNPEFTMLEWSRAYASLVDIERDAEELTKCALDAVSRGASKVEFNGHVVRLVGSPWERLTVREAIQRHLGAKIGEGFTAVELLGAARHAGISVPTASESSAHDLITLLIDAVQPKLGLEIPCFLTDWPSFMTSSGEQSKESSTIACRSELFIGGVEIADGFPSLRDAQRQRLTFQEQLHNRQLVGRPPVEFDTRYVAALDEGIPPSAGMALGLDRLVMALTGADQIGDVLAFPWHER